MYNSRDFVTMFKARGSTNEQTKTVLGKEHNILGGSYSTTINYSMFPEDLTLFEPNRSFIAYWWGYIIMIYTDNTIEIINLMYNVA